jgi:nitrile hydratase accessory protein
MAELDKQIANMEGEVALPRSNGELVFAEPWEGRAFGIAVALNESGLYPWRDFRNELVGQIAAAEQEGDASTYYMRWLRSLESLLLNTGVLAPDELNHRTEQFASGELDDDDHDHNE